MKKIIIFSLIAFIFCGCFFSVNPYAKDVRDPKALMPDSRKTWGEYEAELNRNYARTEREQREREAREQAELAQKDTNTSVTYETESGYESDDDIRGFYKIPHNNPAPSSDEAEEGLNTYPDNSNQQVTNGENTPTTDEIKEEQHPSIIPADQQYFKLSETLKVWFRNLPPVRFINDILVWGIGIGHC